MTRHLVSNFYCDKNTYTEADLRSSNSIYNPIRGLLNYGVIIGPRYSYEYPPQLHTAYGTYPPKLRLVLGDVSISLAPSTASPADGIRLNRTAANFFSVETALSSTQYVCFEDPWITSCALLWRSVGEESWGRIEYRPNSKGTAAQVSVPANTFPSGSIEWYLEITDSGGVQTQTEVRSASTVDTVPSAAALRPSGSIENGADPIVFQWSHINESGTSPTKSEIQFTQDTSAWSATQTIPGSALTYEAAAGTFAAGTWYWRARTYNIDDVAGSWSEAASFIVVAAPPAPSLLIVDASPRPKIQWQTAEQEAYQISLDGQLVGTYYGASKLWTSPTYLEDGAHTIQVRTQNVLGLWGPWASASLLIENEPLDAIILGVSTDDDAWLSWNAGQHDQYLVYRNGVPIAKTSDGNWRDIYCCGPAEYMVRGIDNDSGNYAQSNTVSVNIRPAHPILLLIGTDTRIELPYSSQQHRVYDITAERDIGTLQLSGRRYPTTEASEHYGLTISITASFLNDDRPDALSTMLGQQCCLKLPSGERVMGTMSRLRSAVGLFYTDYSISLTQEAIQEEIDIDA